MSHSPNEEFVPAGPEEFQKLLENFTPALSQLIKTISEEVDHRLTEVEDIIYQYRDISGLQGMIKEHELWTTSVGYLNDVSEYHHGLKHFMKIKEELISHPVNVQWQEVLHLLTTSLEKEDPNNIFVTCFTPNGDQLSQWRGYASDGYGYAVGFDTSKFANIMPSPMALNVMYNEDQQRRFTKALLRRGFIVCEEALSQASITPTPAAVAGLLAFGVRIMLPCFKHAGFAEEKECRLYLVTDFDPSSKETMKYHQRKGLLIPHIPLKWESGKLPIKEIIVGPNLKFEQARWSLQHLLQQHGYTDVEIKQSTVPYLA